MAKKISKSIRVVSLRMVREKSISYEAPIFQSENVVDLVRPILAGSYRECVLVVGLDNAQKPTVIHTVGTGSPTQSPVFVANVLKPLLLSNATSFIVVHNHPSGILAPSSADKVITKRLKDAGNLVEIHMSDHIIVSGDCSEFYSFRRNGLI